QCCEAKPRIRSLKTRESESRTDNDRSLARVVRRAAKGNSRAAARLPPHLANGIGPPPVGRDGLLHFHRRLVGEDGVNRSRCGPAVARRWESGCHHARAEETAGIPVSQRSGGTLGDHPRILAQKFFDALARSAEQLS